MATIDEDATVKVDASDEPITMVHGRGGSQMDVAIPGKLGGAFDVAPVAQEALNPGAPAKSVEGWVLLATNLHEDTSEEDVQDFFADYGTVRLVRVMNDHKRARCIGHALVEFAEASDARAAIEQGRGKPFLGGLPIGIDWAFVVPPAAVETMEEEEAATAATAAAGGDGGDGGGGGGGKAKASGKRSADEITKAPSGVVDDGGERAARREAMDEDGAV